MNNQWAEGKLFQGLLGVTPVALYTPVLTRNGQAKIATLFLANNHTSPVAFTIWTGTAAVDAAIIFPGTELEANTLWVPSFSLYLGFGESLWGAADMADVITVTLNGGVQR